MSHSPIHPIWATEFSPLQTAVHGLYTVEDTLYMHTYLLAMHELGPRDKSGNLISNETQLNIVVSRFETLFPEVSLALIKSTFALHPFTKLWCSSYYGVKIP